MEVLPLACFIAKDKLPFVRLCQVRDEEVVVTSHDDKGSLIRALTEQPSPRQFISLIRDGNSYAPLALTYAMFNTIKDHWKVTETYDEHIKRPTLTVDGRQSVVTSLKIEDWPGNVSAEKVSGTQLCYTLCSVRIIESQYSIRTIAVYLRTTAAEAAWIITHPNEDVQKYVSQSAQDTLPTHLAIGEFAIEHWPAYLGHLAKGIQDQSTWSMRIDSPNSNESNPRYKTMNYCVQTTARAAEVTDGNAQILAALLEMSTTGSSARDSALADLVKRARDLHNFALGLKLEAEFKAGALKASRDSEMETPYKPEIAKMSPM